MKRILIALALSALTLIGGHFYNRRWDRAVFSFVLLLVLLIAVLVTKIGSGQVYLELSAFYYGALGLWVVNIIVAVNDARSPVPPSMAAWTASGVFGAVGLSVFTVLLLLRPVDPLLIYAGTTYFAEIADSTSGATHAVSGKHFSNYLYLGHIAGEWKDFAKPPSGDGYLRGRFVYSGKPAGGVELSLTLNGKYETERTTTDENGIFTFRLPPGEWTINRLITHQWSERPAEGEFMVVTGSEPRLTGDDYDEHYWFRHAGLKVDVRDQPGEPQLTFTIRDRVALIWPGDEGMQTKATLSDAVVQWEAYPGAEIYLVRIAELERKGRTTRFHPVATRRVSGQTAFAVATLPAVQAEEEKEYEARVLAFAANGSLLSESSKFTGSFVLSDKKRLVRDEERGALTDSTRIEDLEELHRNQERIRAIETLLKDDLVAEAQTVYGRIGGRVDPGRKDAIAGYLAAKRGRCEEAKRLFDRARTEGGRDCVPRSYWAGCRN